MLGWALTFVQFLDLIIRDFFQTAFCKCQGEKSNFILKSLNFCFLLIVAFYKQRLGSLYKVWGVFCFCLKWKRRGYDRKELTALLVVYTISSSVVYFALEELPGEKSCKIRSLVAGQRRHSSLACWGVTEERMCQEEAGGAYGKNRCDSEVDNYARRKYNHQKGMADKSRLFSFLLLLFLYFIPF